MKNTFQDPEVTVVKLQENDVISTSGCVGLGGLGGSS